MQKNISSNRKYLNFFSSSLFFSFEKWQCGASHSRPNSASGLQGRTGRTGPATAQLANPSDRGRASARSPLDPSLLDPHATHTRAHPPPPWHPLLARSRASFAPPSGEPLLPRRPGPPLLSLAPLLLCTSSSRQRRPWPPPANRPFPSFHGLSLLCAPPLLCTSSSGHRRPGHPPPGQLSLFLLHSVPFPSVPSFLRSLPFGEEINF